MLFADDSLARSLPLVACQRGGRRKPREAIGSNSSTRSARETLRDLHETLCQQKMICSPPLEEPDRAEPSHCVVRLEYPADDLAELLPQHFESGSGRAQ